MRRITRGNEAVDELRNEVLRLIDNYERLVGQIRTRRRIQEINQISERVNEIITDLETRVEQEEPQIQRPEQIELLGEVDETALRRELNRLRRAFRREDTQIQDEFPQQPLQDDEQQQPLQDQSQNNFVDELIAEIRFLTGEYERIYPLIRTRRRIDQINRVAEELEKMVTELEIRIEDVTDGRRDRVNLFGMLDEVALRRQLRELRGILRGRRRRDDEVEDFAPEDDLVENRPIPAQEILVDPNDIEAVQRARVLAGQLTNDVSDAEFRYANLYLRRKFIGIENANAALRNVIDVMRFHFAQTYALEEPGNVLDVQQNEFIDADRKLLATLNELGEQQEVHMQNAGLRIRNNEAMYERDAGAFARAYYQSLNMAIPKDPNLTTLGYPTTNISPNLDTKAVFNPYLDCPYRHDPAIERLEFYMRLRGIINEFNVQPETQHIFQITPNAPTLDPLQWLILSIKNLQSFLERRIGGHRTPDIPYSDETVDNIITTAGLDENQYTMDNGRVVGPDYLFDMFMGQDHQGIINGAADFNLLSVPEKQLLRLRCKQKFLLAWSIGTLTDNPDELSIVFDYLYDGAPILRLFQMAYGSPGTGEVKLELYDYAAYIYKMFADLPDEFEFGVRRQDAQRIYGEYWSELLDGCFKRAYAYTYLDYVRLFKSDLFMCIRVLTLVSVDFIKIVEYIGKTNLDVRKFYCEPVNPNNQFFSITQRFSRFTALLLGGLSDQRFVFDQRADEGGILNYGAKMVVSVQGINTLHVIMAMYDQIYKAFSFETLPAERSKIYLQTFAADFVFQKGSVTNKQQNNASNTVNKIPIAGLDAQGRIQINGIIQQDFDVSVVQTLELGTYAVVDNRRENELRFSLENVDRVCDILYTQFYRLMSTSYARAVADTGQIGWRIELLLAIENVYNYFGDVAIEPLLERSEKSLGVKLTLPRQSVAGMLQDPGRGREFLRQVVRRTLQIETHETHFEDEPMPIEDIIVEGINIDDADYYESGLSQDDLLNMYVDQNVDPQLYIRKLDIRTEDDAQGNRQRIRRNFYFENSQVNNTYTVTIARAAQVIFNPEGNFRWWKTRAVTQQLLRRRKRVQNDIWTKLSGEARFQNEGYIPVRVKCETAYLWRKIENMFERLNCQQHLFLYGLCVMGLLSAEDILANEFFDYEAHQNFFMGWIEFREIGNNFGYLRDVLQELNEQFENREGYKIIDIEFFDADAPEDAGAVVLSLYTPQTELFDETSVLLMHKHVAVFDRNSARVRVMKMLHENSENITSTILQAKRDKNGNKNNNFLRNFGKNFSAQHMRVQHHDRAGQNVLRHLFETHQGEYQTYYQNHLKIKKVKDENVEKIYFYYDMETTTMKKVEVGEKLSMKVYLVCVRVVFAGYGLEEDCPGQRGYCDKYRHGQKIVFEGRYAQQNFVMFIKELLYDIITKKEKRKCYFTGWNSRKFDSQFVIEKLIRDLPYDAKLTGTITNPKVFHIADMIHFHDAMDMVSPMSLQKFCKAMQVPGKFDSSVIFLVTDLDAFENLSEENHRKIVEYCQQDVDAMAQAINKFNSLMIHIVREMRGNSVEIPKHHWILAKTMAKLAYTLFMEYYFLPIMPVMPLQSFELFRDVSTSYRGGYVNNFYFGLVNAESPNQNEMKILDYVDVNSLYPSVMAEAFIPLDFSQNFVEEKFRVSSHFFAAQAINPLNLYRVVSFCTHRENYCSQTGEQNFGFFAVKSFDRNNNVTKTIYPRTWVTANNPKQPYLVVWGTELLLFAKLFEECGGFVEVVGYWQCMEKGKIFAPIREMYQKRLIYKNDPEKKALGECLKIKMNSCYGRFGMKAYEVHKYFHENSLNGLEPQQRMAYMQQEIEKTGAESLRSVQHEQIFEDVRMIETGNNGQILKFRLEGEDKYMPKNETQRLKHVASFISTQARCRLFATLYQISRVCKLSSGIMQTKKFVKVIYCDTDSVVYGAPDADLKNRVENLVPIRWCELDNSYTSSVRISADLGDLKSEIEEGSTMTQFQVFGPKFYRYKIRAGDHEHWVFKSKGISQKVITEFDEKENERLNKLKQAHFFESFELNLSAKIEEEQIRSRRGEMVLSRFVKENRLTLGRKLSQRKVDDHLNETLAFDDLESYKEHRSKNIELNVNSNHYVYL